jgi:hypothetical protein
MSRVSSIDYFLLQATIFASLKIPFATMNRNHPLKELLPNGSIVDFDIRFDINVSYEVFALYLCLDCKSRIRNTKLRMFVEVENGPWRRKIICIGCGNVK